MIELLISYVLGIGSSLTTVWLVPRLRKRSLSEKQKELLHFESGELLIVFPQSGVRDGGLLPTVSTEDTMAVLNISRALTVAGLSDKIELRDSSKFVGSGADDKQKNLILLGGPKFNPVTKELFSILEKTNRAPFRFESKNEKWRLKESNTTIHKSQAFAKKNAKTPKEIHEVRQATEAMGLVTDIAIIAGLPNPWELNSRILLIAGVRGIGTWGAAKLLRKEGPRLASKLKKQNFSVGDRGLEFWALVDVRYEEYDIDYHKIRYILKPE